MTNLLGRPDEHPGCILVGFRLPHAVDAERVTVVGDFNDWSRDANPLERDDDGFATTIPLLAGRAYRFRYLLDDERWENDWAADEYVPNEFGGEDSVVDLTDRPLEGLPDQAMVADVEAVALDGAATPPARSPEPEPAERPKPKRTRKKPAAS